MHFIFTILAYGIVYDSTFLYFYFKYLFKIKIYIYHSNGITFKSLLYRQGIPVFDKKGKRHFLTCSMTQSYLSLFTIHAFQECKAFRNVNLPELWNVSGSVSNQRWARLIATSVLLFFFIPYVQEAHTQEHYISKC